MRDVRLPLKLNWDVDYLSLDEQSTNYKLNCRAFGPDGGNGINTNLEGTEAIQSPSFLDGTELKGWCRDTKRKAIILFLYIGDADSSKIVSYSINDGSLSSLITSSMLNLLDRWVFPFIH